MSNNLYYEAIEAAEEIKLAAEEKVKQRLIESMTPQIKSLVEKKLFEDKAYEKKEILLDEPSEIKELDEELSQDTSEYMTEEELDVNCGTENIDESTIASILTKNAKFTEAFLKLENIKSGIANLKEAKILIESNGDKVNENKKFIQLYKLLLNEIKKLRSNNIIKNNDDLLKEFYNINKEIYNMSKRRSYNELDHLLEMNLFEEDEVETKEESEAESDELEIDDADMSSDMGSDDDSEDDSEDDAKELEAALEDIMKTAKDALGGDDSDDEDEDEDSLQLDGLFEMDDMQDDHMEMIDSGLDEAELDETEEGMCSGTDEMTESFGQRDRVLEIDENMLRREIGRMKAIREGEARDMASHFGGGSLEGEAFVDGVELNKLHEIKTKAAKVIRRNRMLESKLSQYKKALRGMKGQLSEMNLFNAKLLYANKLMQNRDLSIKQQRHIVESLDDAKTLGEAKILFESLSKSLVSSKNTRSNGSLTEGALRRNTGSSSAPVKSAQPLNESVALDRWATLAGIKK